MAQLPPKIPISMSTNWPDNNPFPHHHHHHHQFQMAINTSHDEYSDQQQHSQHCWDSLDDFSHFAAARRGSHRRSASDGVAFLEYCSAPPLINMINHDHHDHELMMMSCMFSAAAAPPTLSSPSTDPSSPSDGGAANNSNMLLDDMKMIMSSTHDDDDDNNDNVVIISDLFNDDERLRRPKAEPGEVESRPPSCEAAAGETHAPPPSSPGVDAISDPKRIKRILANRQSAQRSRVRKLQYISELERSVTTLQSEVSALSPRVAFLDHQRLILNVDNGALKQRIAALAQDKIFKDAHQEALRSEIERLRQVYHQQNLKKMANQNSHDHNSDDNIDAHGYCTDNVEHITNTNSIS